MIGRFRRRGRWCDARAYGTRKSAQEEHQAPPTDLGKRIAPGVEQNAMMMRVLDWDGIGSGSELG